VVDKESIFEWDVWNWSKALPFWERHLPSNWKGITVLEIGARRGGISLWLASHGAQVVCSDLENPRRIAQPYHDQFSFAGSIRYEAVDALNIRKTDFYDLIVFKSVMGGVSRHDCDKKKLAMVRGIFCALKPGGKLLFAENLTASPLHSLTRRLFLPWGAEWNYLRLDELEEHFADFRNFEFATSGFLGAFGRSESLRKILGKVDDSVEQLIPKRWHYIVYGMAER
jgi:hypothetical protein